MKNFKKIIALVMAVILAFSVVGCSSKTGVEDDGTQTEIVTAINGAGKFLVKKITSPTYGDETAVIALNRSTYIDYWHNISRLYEDKLTHVVRSNGYVLGKNGKVYVDGYDDVILAHTAIGVLADKASANDFTQGISYDSVVMEGGYLNKINCLIALESGKYPMFKDGDLTRDDLIDFTMELQKSDGSFRYKGMDGITPVKVTAAAVTALSLTGETGENGEITQAIENGLNYLTVAIRETDSLDDIVSTIIALNTTGNTAMDVQGKDLTQWIMKYSKEDGGFSVNAEDKKSNKEDTALVLLGLASQYRFNKGMTSVYDMSDVLGATHNKLSPEWEMNMELIRYFIYFLCVFLIGLYIVSRIRVNRWKKAGYWDPVTDKLRPDVTPEMLYPKKNKKSKDGNTEAEK